MINRKIPWTSQPQYPVDIDRSNPLGAKVVYASTLAGGYAYDSVARKLGVNTAAVAKATPRGMALNFNGSSAYITLPTTNLVAAYPLTVSCWFERPATTSGGVLYSLNGASYSAIGGFYNLNGGNFITNVGSNPATTGYLHSNFLAGWNHIVVIHRSGSWDLYVNGVGPVTLTTANNWGQPSAGNHSIGNRLNGASPQYFNGGGIQDFIVFRGELSADEAKQVYLDAYQIFQPPQRRIWVAGTSSGSTGTVAVTNANDTSSASGTTTVTGSVAKSNANDTSAASGTTTITGSLARTNVNDTSAASGTPTVTGTLAKTNANDTSAASGTTTVVGTLATTNANDTVSASGAVGNSITGTVAYTNANDTLSASGTTTIVGTVSGTNANDTSTANGTTTVIGTVAKTNVNDTVAASGIVGTISGTVAYTNANDIATASGTTPETNRYSGGYEQEYTKGHPWIYPISRPRIEDIIPDAEQDLVEAIIAAVDVAENKVDAEKKNISSPIGSLEKEFAVAEKELKKYLKSQKQAWAEEYAAVIKAETEWRQARQQALQQQIIEEDQLLILLLAA